MGPKKWKRSDTVSEIFPKRDLPRNVLPTRREVRCYINKVYDDFCQEQKLQKLHTGFVTVYSVVADEVMQLWKREGIPVLSRSRVIALLKQCVEKSQKMVKKEHRKANLRNPTACEDSSWFAEIFDIAICKCSDVRSCTCPREQRVPDLEIEFLLDQRGERKMMMSGMDKRETERRQKREKRKQRASSRSVPQPLSEPGPSGPSHTEPGLPGLESSATSSLSSQPSSTVSGLVFEQQTSGDRCSDELTHTAMAADRYGLSNRACAAVLNAYQIDIGRLKPGDNASAIDSMKVWRAREKVRRTSRSDKQTRVRTAGLTGLYSDGRKDLTLGKALSKDRDSMSRWFRNLEAFI